MMWTRVTKFDPRAVAIYERHYSCRRYADGRKRTQCAPPGETIVLLTPDADALFIWVHNTVPRYDKQVGVNCAAFRNESTILSSTLITSACELAWERWPGLRLFTYVADTKIRSVNPGYCFKCAGFRNAGRSKSGLTLLERLPGAE